MRRIAMEKGKNSAPSEHVPDYSISSGINAE
uniref:Uncharacterized protein n=1 Tax=Anguilla anguilla TaxID=7936 RepID=A0A0E9PBR9_ANGAN